MQQQQQKQLSKAGFGCSILLMLTLLIATVASVPTSVLVQSSELNSSASSMNENLHNNHNNNNNIGASKVKRSSMSMSSSGSMPSENAVAALNKKSSPEVVPASFNAPPAKPVSSSAAAVPTASAAIISLPSNGDIINSAIVAGLAAAAVEAAAAANQRNMEEQQQAQQWYDYGEETTSPLHKRGISSPQYLYAGGLGAATGNMIGSTPLNAGYADADFYNNPYLAHAATSNDMSYTPTANGIWTDEMDPASIIYTDLDEYEPVQVRAPSYRNKAYDNLQSLLNSETYLEPATAALPVQYPAARYYGNMDNERNSNKRSSFKKYNKFADMRLKRDTKLTPADMLALVALVEAGERARKDTDAEEEVNYNGYYPSVPVATYSNAKSYASNGNYDYPNAALDEVDYNAGNAGGWSEPANLMDYYGSPVNMETVPKYELSRLGEINKYASNNNRFSTKRYMVAKKKKRSLAKPSIPYNAKAENYF